MAGPQASTVLLVTAAPAAATVVAGLEAELDAATRGAVLVCAETARAKGKIAIIKSIPTALHLGQSANSS